VGGLAPKASLNVNFWNFGGLAFLRVINAFCSVQDLLELFKHTAYSGASIRGYKVIWEPVPAPSRWR
jgi:hypothetical protein